MRGDIARLIIDRDSGQDNTPLVWAIEGDREFVVMSLTDGPGS